MGEWKQESVKKTATKNRKRKRKRGDINGQQQLKKGYENRNRDRREHNR